MGNRLRGLLGSISGLATVPKERASWTLIRALQSPTWEPI
jgi:hypothetical protein